MTTKRKLLIALLLLLAILLILAGFVVYGLFLMAEEDRMGY